MAGPYKCFTCGQEWPEHPFLAVECPTCQAPAGSWCRRPSAHAGRGFTDIHVAREELALARGAVQMCPQGPTAKGPASSPRQGVLPL